MSKNILITIKKELRGIIRDKKSLLMMLVTPILIPIFIFVFSYIYDMMLQESPEETYVIGINYELSEVEKEITNSLKLETKFYDSKDALNKSYEEHEINAYIVKENEKFIIYSNPKDTESTQVSSLANAYLEEYNTYLGQNYLVNMGIDLNNVYNNIQISNEELQGNNFMVNMIIFLGIVFAMMAISLTAIYGVTDSTAGEKERGTLETFLTFPIKSKELILGKYLAVSISCIVTSIIGTILVVASIGIASNMFEIYKGAVMNINISSILITLLIMISYSFFISGLCIAIASFSKSYKEAQSALTPISFITMIPMFFNILSVNLSTGLSFVPVVSHTMLINDILCVGLNNNSILHGAIIVLSTLIYSIVIIKVITKMYKNEKILFSI